MKSIRDYKFISVRKLIQLHAEPEKDENDFYEGFEEPLFDSLIAMEQNPNSKTSAVLKKIVALYMRPLSEETRAALQLAQQMTLEFQVKPLEQNKDLYLSYSELANDLAYLSPETEDLGLSMMPLAEQANFAITALSQSLVNLNQGHVLDALIRDFCPKLQLIEKQNVRDSILLIQELWQVNRMLHSDDIFEYQGLQEEYLDLRAELRLSQTNKIQRGWANIGTVSLGAICCVGIDDLAPALDWIRGLNGNGNMDLELTSPRSPSMLGSHSEFKLYRNNIRVFSSTAQLSSRNDSRRPSLSDNIANSPPWHGVPSIGFAWNLNCLSIQKLHFDAWTDDEISNESIVAWQTRQSFPLENKISDKAIFGDIVRNGKIQGVKVGEDQCREAFNNLIEKAERYSPENREMIWQWICRFGGQNGIYNLFFVLISHGHIQCSKPGSYMIGGNRINQPEWNIENGKIVCEYEMSVHSLIYKNTTPNTQFLSLGPDCSLNFSEEPPETKTNENMLLFCRAKIRLDLSRMENSEALTVVPRVTVLQIASTTDELKPSKILLPDEDHELSHAILNIPSTYSQVKERLRQYNLNSTNPPEYKIQEIEIQALIHQVPPPSREHTAILKEILALRKKADFKPSQKICILLDLCYELIQDATHYSKIDTQDFHLALGELSSDLAYLNPQTTELSKMLMPLKDQAQFALMRFTQTLHQCNQDHALEKLTRNLPERLSRMEKYNERESIILIQEIWLLNRLVAAHFNSEEFKILKDEYKTLRDELNKRQWTKIKKGLAIGALVSIGSTIVTGGFGFLPNLAWISGLVATKATGGSLLGASARYFGSGGRKIIRAKWGTKKVLSALNSYEMKTIQEEKPSVSTSEASLLSSEISSSSDLDSEISALPDYAWSLSCKPMLNALQEPFIANESIFLWQGMIPLHAEFTKSPAQVLTDIPGDLLIDGNKVSESDCYVAMNKLIDKCTTQEADKSLIRAWINSYGGTKGIYFLIPTLIRQGHIQIQDTRALYQIHSFHLHQARWELVNNKIHCAYDVVITSLQSTDKNKHSHYYTLDKENKLARSDTPPEAKDQLDPVLLARVRTRLDILPEEVNTNLTRMVVVPQVVCLNIASSTPDLEPSPILTKDAELSPKQQKFKARTPESSTESTGSTSPTSLSFSIFRGSPSRRPSTVTHVFVDPEPLASASSTTPLRRNSLLANNNPTGDIDDFIKANDPQNRL